MNVRISIDRAAAIRAGRNTYGNTIVAIDPADLFPEDRDTLARATERDGITDLTKTPIQDATYPPYPVLAYADDELDAVRMFLGWRRLCARVAEERRLADEAEEKRLWEEAEEETRAYIEYWSTQPAEEFVMFSLSSNEDYKSALPVVYGKPRLPEIPRYTELWDRAGKALEPKLVEACEIIAQRERDRIERKERAEAEKQAAAQRRAEQLAAWVLEHGTQNQQGRLERGLLPEAEVVNDIRAQVFAPLDPFERYVNIRSTDIEHRETCYGGGLDCEIDEALALDAEEFERFAEIEQKAPDGAELKAMAHSCTCEGCEAGLTRRSVRVRITLGELTLSREYAL